MSSSRLKRLALLGLVLSVAACSQVVNQRDGDPHNDAQVNPFTSYVEYDVEPGIVLNYPHRVCIGAVTVAPSDDAKSQDKPADAGATMEAAADKEQADREKAEKAKERAELPEMIRQSLAAHARARFDDLGIAVAAAKSVADEVAAALDGCSYWLTAKLLVDDEINTLFWARRRLGVELRLADVDTNETLWSARHVASRNEASVPLDPVSVVVGLFRTQDFAMDRDVLPSMVDDVMRRLFATFPDLPADEREAAHPAPAAQPAASTVGAADIKSP